MEPFFWNRFFETSLCGQVMPPKGTKRPSGGGSGAKAKAQKSTPGIPAESMKMEHMKKFEQWMSL